VEHARVVRRELTLQARPRRVGAGPRVELRPRRVAEEVRHHPEDGHSSAPGSSGVNACRAGWQHRGPGGGGWRGARARRRVRARTVGPATACRCRAAGGAAFTPGRRGGPPSPERWPSAPPSAAPAPTRPLWGLRVTGIAAGRVRRARWGAK
jgi:hypothetical protein